MRNNIAYFEKTSSSKVIFWAKLNAKINSALIFSTILTLLLLVFSKEAILFLIYLLAFLFMYNSIGWKFLKLCTHYRASPHGTNFWWLMKNSNFSSPIYSTFCYIVNYFRNFYFLITVYKNNTTRKWRNREEIGVI